MTDYDAVVFDSDGVLVELTPMDTLREAVREAFADVGVTDPDERFVGFAANGDLDAALGVVSNNQRATVETVVEAFGLRDRVETVYGREPTVAGARRRKPDTHTSTRRSTTWGRETPSTSPTARRTW